MKRFLIGLGLAALLALPAHAVSIKNGSFEKDPFQGTNGSFDGNASITDWIVTGSVDLYGFGFTAYEGSQSIDLNGSQPGTISQILDGFTVGKAYTVNFVMGGFFRSSLAGSAPETKTLVASILGVSAQNFSAIGTEIPDITWEEKSFSFVAQNTEHTLQFASTTPNTAGPALDAITISTIPLPAAGLLLVTAAGGLACLRRRKHRKS